VDGAVLARAREAAGLSQSALAVKIGASSKQRIWHWERGAEQPHPRFVPAIARVLRICLYGLFGATVVDILKTGTWWEWAAAVWLIVALLGIRHIEVNTRVIAIVLVVEIAIIGMLIAAALTHPAAAVSGSSMTALKPSALFTNGVGVVLAFTVASFVGFESVIAYREEAREWRAVRRAAIGAVLFLGVFYALASWSLTITVGPSQIIDATRDPAAGLPFSILKVHYGQFWSGLGQAVLITSIFGALISFTMWSLATHSGSPVRAFCLPASGSSAGRSAAYLLVAPSRNP
jgi:amino acid transporter